MDDKNMPEKNNISPDKTKNKSKVILLSTKPISDEDLQNQLNKEFGESNQYYSVLKEAVESLTITYKEKLKKLMMVIKDGIKPDIKMVDGVIKSIEFKRKLSNDELENYVLSIPVELFFVQEFMDDRALDMELSNQLTNFHITEKILEIHGGTEKERIRAAEYNSMVQIFTSIIKKAVYNNLKNEIDQASKVYDALKRVIQLRITEMQTFGRSQEYGTVRHSNNEEKSVEEFDYEPILIDDPTIADVVITTNKYPDGITVQDLFFANESYFNWICDRKSVTGNFIEYQKVIKQYKTKFFELNPNYISKDK